MNYFIENKKKLQKKIQCSIFFVFFLFFTPLYAQVDRNMIDSLKTLLHTQHMADNELFSIYNKLSDTYLYIDSKKSLEYAQMGIRLAGEKHNLYQMANSYYYAGKSYALNQPDSALYCYEQSLAILQQAEKSGIENEKYASLLRFGLFWGIGLINQGYGKYEVALDYYFKALAIAEKINNPKEKAKIYRDIAETYNVQSNFRQAEIYYLKGEALSRELKDSIALATIYQGLCRVFIYRKDYPQALKYGEESYRILSVQSNVLTANIMNTSILLTEVWLKIPNYDQAMEYARKTVEYAQQTGISSYIATALYMLSHCYLKQQKYAESEKTALEALATDTSDVYINSILYETIALANIWMGNSAKSDEYFRKTTNAIRAYSNKNFQSSLSEMEVKYETEKKELKITGLEKEKRLMTELGIAAGAVLLLTLATFFFLWRWSLQRRRVAEQQQQLAEQQHNIAQQQVKQLEQEKQLVATQAVLDGETRERARLARDLHDGLGSMLTGMKLKLLEMKKGAKLDYPDVERFDNALRLLDDSVVEMRRVAHHLMPDSLSRFGLKPAVNDFCTNFPSVQFSYYGDESRLEPKLEVMIYRSIHELVNNALKYAGASQILVQIIQEPGRIAFTVQDDGCGFDPAAESKGMGLQNIRTRVASYNGIFNIDSKPGEGTEVNVELTT